MDTRWGLGAAHGQLLYSVKAVTVYSSLGPDCRVYYVSVIGMGRAVCHGAQQNFTDAFSLAKNHFDNMFATFLLLSKLQSVGGKEKRTSSSARSQETERC